MTKKTLLAFIVILFFAVTNSVAQQNNNYELAITFKQESAELSKKNKDKLISFIQKYPIDSNHLYKIQRWTDMEYTHLESRRYEAVKNFLHKSGIPGEKVFWQYRIPSDERTIRLKVAHKNEFPLNRPVKIIFKQVSGELLEKEKEKIIEFIKMHPLNADSNYAFKIEYGAVGSTSAKELTDKRLMVITNYLRENNIKQIIWDDIQTVAGNTVELLLVKTAPTHIPPPFPKFNR